MIFHEGEACDAVIRVLDAKAGRTRHDVDSPEQNGHYAPIELTCHIGDRLFAFEHTGIEPFAGHVKFQAEARKHIDPILVMLAGKLPPDDVFELHMPAMAMQGRRAREVAQIQIALAAWIKATAPTVKAVPYASYDPRVRKMRPVDVPFDVALYRFLPAAPVPGFLQIRHEISGNQQQAREDRLRESCGKKLPKLEVWRRDSGARTVLVLEDNDNQLTNAELVFQALTNIENTIADKPNEIYLVTTYIETLWFVHALRIDQNTYYQLSQAGQCMTRVDPSTLADLTGR
jgi:hypothetical protein